MLHQALMYREISGNQRLGFPGEREAMAALELSLLEGSEFLEKALSTSMHTDLVLGKKDLFEKLSLREILVFILKDKRLAKKIATPEILEHFDDDELIFWSGLLFKVAKSIIDTPTLLARFNQDGFIRICLSHIKLVRLINLNALQSLNLEFLGTEHLEIALEIIRSEELRRNIGPNLYKLCQAHSQVALEALALDPLPLNGNALGEIGFKNLSFATEVVRRIELHDPLEDIDIYRLASVDGDLAIEIIKTPSLRCNMSNDTLTYIGRKFLKAAKHIIQNNYLSDNNEILKIISGHPELLKNYLEDPALQVRLPRNRELVTACSLSTIEVARSFLIYTNSNPILGETYYSLRRTMGYYHSEIAFELFLDLNQQNLLTSADLSYLGRHLKVSRLIFSSSILMDLLAPTDLVKLIMTKEENANFILNTPKLRDKLSTADFCNLHFCGYPSVKKCFELHSVLSKLDTDTLAFSALENPRTALRALQLPSTLRKLQSHELFYSVVLDSQEAIDYVLNNKEILDELLKITQRPGHRFGIDRNKKSRKYLRTLLPILNTEDEKSHVNRIIHLGSLIFEAFNKIEAHPVVDETNTKKRPLESGSNDDDNDDDVDDKPAKKAKKM